MGEVVPFPAHRIVREPWLTKRQLASHYGRTVRWVEQQMQEGMPSELRNGLRVFQLSAVTLWSREQSA